MLILKEKRSSYVCRFLQLPASLRVLFTRLSNLCVISIIPFFFLYIVVSSIMLILVIMKRYNTHMILNQNLQAANALFDANRSCKVSKDS
jgi:hypothetical protein